MTVHLDRWQEIAGAVNVFLEALLGSLRGCPSSLMEALSYSVLGDGKRFRPLLVFAGADLFSLPFSASLRIAAAVELVHAYSLIHDDLPAMDDATWRRGKKACHLAFSEGLAILAGDGLIPLAFSVLLDSKTHPCAQKRLELCRLLGGAIGPEGIVAGQTHDIENVGKTLSASQLTRLHLLKTGALIRFSLLAPASLSDRFEVERPSLCLFSDHLGLSFQIADDLLDLQRAQKTGKDQGTDAKVNKTTWVTLLGEAGAREALVRHQKDATQILSRWGERASFLKDILDFAVCREK